MPEQRSFQNAVKWAYVANWGERGFSAFFTFVLAALLGPRDFGLVAVALVFIAFMQMFLDQGLAAALIQRKNLEQEHLDAVFWVNLALGVLLALVCVGFSRKWAAINHAPEIASLTLVLSLCIPIEGLSIVQSALLKREMDFKSFSIRSNASVLLSGIVGLGMAYAGFRVWALVAQQLVRDITALVLLWKFSPWRPRIEFSWKHLKDLLHFSISNFIGQLGIFADMQTGAILLGMLFGPIAVGLYRFADRLMNTVLVATTSSVQSVSLSEFSRFQHEPDKLRKSALDCIHLSSTVTLPAMAGLAAVSGPLMATIGSKWIPAADVLKVLCGLGMALVFVYFTGPILQALSMTHQFAMLEWVRTIVGGVLLFAAGLIVRNGSVTWQIMGITIARFVSGVFLVAPVFLYILLRLADISVRDLVATIAPSIASSATIVLSVFAFSFCGLLTRGKPLILLIAEVVLGGVVGFVVLFGLDKQLRLKMLGLLRGLVGPETAFPWMT
jgi:O-antigen/teichoic acid export membrane protein